MRSFSRKNYHSSPCRFTRLRRTAGFTAIELIGVLAVIAVLAAAITPVMIRRIDQAARSRDAAELCGLAEALRATILRTGQIPDSNTIVSVLANEMAVSTNQVAASSRHVARAILIDPNLWIGSATGWLPYNQSQFPWGTGTNSGALNVPGLNLRMMFISSLGVTLPASIDFDTAWATPDGVIPAGWSWTGRADDLKIQRVDLTRLFHRVILNPIDTNNFGSFAIESGQAVSSTNGLASIISNSWYLSSTAFRLYDTNAGYATFTMEIKPVVQTDFSYVFEGAAWRGQFSGRLNQFNSSTTNFSPAFSSFMAFAGPFTNYPSGPSAPSGATTIEVLRCFYSIMVGYNFWNQENFAMGSRTANTFLNQNEPITSGTLQDIIKN